MRACVIGGAGFIGRRVVQRLAAGGCEVVSLDVEAVSFATAAGRIRSERMDLADFESVVRAFATHAPEVVINLGYLRETVPRRALQVNVLGMDNCFEAARLCGVGRVIYSSSTAVNGLQCDYGERPITETDATHARRQYAVHKVFNEWQGQEYRDKHGMSVVGVRVPYVSGVGKAIGTVDHVHCITRPALGESVAFEYPDVMRCILYVDDIADVLARVATGPAPAHGLYNAGGEPISLGQIADIVRELIPGAVIRFAQESGGRDQSAAWLFDNSRLVSEFGVRYPPYRQRIAEMIEIARRGASA